MVVDLLCDSELDEGGEVTDLPAERRLSALKIPGAHLVFRDNVEVELTAETLDNRGVATENIRVANVVPFIVLKSLAYQDRFEEKDAYDLVYCLMYYRTGPLDVATQFVNQLQLWPNEPLLRHAIEILRSRFASDERSPGYRKDGPTSYARFLTDPAQTSLDATRRQDAAAVVEQFLQAIDAAT